MRLPSEEDINVYGSRDEAEAVKNFHNKTLEEAEALFRDGSTYYQEDLMWMGMRAFQFYSQAALNYLQSDASTGDAGFVRALYGIIVTRSGNKDFSVASENVKKLMDYVIDHYQKFHVSVSIYGDLLEKYRQLRDRLEATE